MASDHVCSNGLVCDGAAKYHESRQKNMFDVKTVVLKRLFE